MSTFNFPIFLIFECWADYSESKSMLIAVKSTLNEAKSFVENKCKTEPITDIYVSYGIVKISDFGELDELNSQIAYYDLKSDGDWKWTTNE